VDPDPDPDPDPELELELLDLELLELRRAQRVLGASGERLV
jgi:hypothetical protein